MNSFSSRVAAAATAIRQIFPETPLQENDYLSKKTGARAVSYTHLTLPTNREV